MDDAFGNLGDISDEQTLERLESLFESSGNFPSLGSPILNDDVATTNNAAAANLFGPLDSNPEIFSNYNNTTTTTSGNSSSATHSNNNNTINDTSTTEGVVLSSSAPLNSSNSLITTSNTNSIGENGPGSVSSSSYTQPSTPATPAPQQPSPSSVKKTPSPAPTQPQVLYATKSTVRTTPQSSASQQSNLILTAPSTAVFNAGSTTPLMQSTGTLQIQLQPNSMRTPAPKPQPQILPKPITQTATKMTVASSVAAHRQLTGSSPLIVNQSGQFLTTTVSQNPILINSLGQVVSGTTASAPQTATPFLIQQPTGNQVFVLRPSTPAPGASATILPTNNQAGTFLLQQPTGPSTVITAQPQVKIITPQGRMQMQQIQTPSGPKLIAVPVGQTLVQTSAGLISTSSNVLAGISPSINLPQQSSLTTSTNSVAVVSNSVPSLPASSPSVTPMPVSPNKKKKSKKRNKDNEILAQASLAPTPSKKPKIVDLGELMKDVGLDLEGFHDDSHQTSNSIDECSNSSKPSQILSSATIVDSSSSGTNAPGSQLVAQIQQPLPLQGTSNQLQLVQGPDGQFVLQSAMQQPTILTQASLDGGTLSIPGGGATPTIIGASLGAALPNTNLNITPTAISGSLIGATSLQTLPQRTTFTTAPSLVNSSFVNRPTASVISTIPTNNLAPLNNNSSINNNNTIVKTINNRSRGNNQSNRVPLYEDDRLPPGWYRKVSQRKSGASAGRYEVFIVGPTGKRFRSKNELKAYFEQTGETTLDSDDFDFSTFGSGRHVNLTVSTPNTLAKAPELITTTTTMTSVQSSQTQMSAIPIPNSNNSIISVRSKASNQDDSLPTLEPNDTILQNDNSNLSSAPNLTPSVQVPPRSLDVLTPSTSTKPVYSSQISRGTEDADAQISQLLKTLQEEPHKLSIDPEFVQSLTGGEVDFDGSITPPPPQLAPAVSKVTTTSHPVRSISKTHQVPELMHASPNLQMRLLSTSSDVVAGTKLKAFTTTLPPSSNNALPQQIIQVSRGDMVPNSSSVNSVSNLTTSGLTSVPIGGVSTQVRALQNLPSNTRLVRGPNGQYTIQKVQTIELSPEMQQSLKEVQSRIQEIEKQVAKSPQDEAELAQLQTRQQRILSLGRPIPTPTSSNITGTSIGMVNPGATISTSSILQVQDKGTPPLPSSCSSNSLMSGGIVTQINTSGGSSSATAIPSVRQPPCLTPSVTVGVPPQPQTSAASTKSVAGPSDMTTTPSGTNIPPLTDQQKRIVAHFKQKMASLPPEQQAQFIAANKASLIRRLNFQPSQIHILCSNRINQQQQGSQQQPAPTQNLLSAPSQFQNSVLSTSGTVQPVSTLETASETAENKAAAAPLGGRTSFLSSTNPDLAPINKHKKIAWVESQVKKDQNEAVHPNIKTPFRSKEDACKRLLRYHVFHELDPNPEKVIDEEASFSAKSQLLLNKFHAMRDKYHYLLMQESMRITTSSEEVMLARLWDSDERQFLTQQKDDFEKRGVILNHLPPVPSSWREKYIQVLGHPPPTQDKSDDQSEYDEFHSIQNELSRYNNINGIGNTSGSSELFEMPPQKIGNEEDKSSVSDGDDGDFSLKDVCGGNGVDAILGGEEDEDRGRREEDMDVPLDFEGSYGQKEVDSVQSAINSILDDRIQTPDINNIAGLLDSFSDATSSGPATESAVNSIPRY